MKKISVDSLVRANVKSLSPYSTARDEAGESFEIYLDANENPYNNSYNRYPDPAQKVLKNEISIRKGVPVNSIFVGNGSDEPIDILYRVFCRPGTDNVVAVAPTYGMYKVAAGVNDVSYREVYLNSDFSLDVVKTLSATDSCTKLLFICSPNNPTGNRFVISDILDLAEAFSGILVVDEAYIDFASGESMLDYLDKFNNIVILQTLSKAFGLAGLRVGLAFSSEKIVSYMNKVKYPYNVNVESQRIAVECVKRGVDEQVGEIVRERERLSKELNEIECVRRVWPSEANFLLVQFDSPLDVYEQMLSMGIVVRNRSSVPLCEGSLRITVGTPAENSKVIEFLKSYKGGLK